MEILAVFLSVFILAQCFNSAVSAKILGVFPVPSISHQVVYRALMEELAKRGHHIVIITPDPLGAKAPPHYNNVTEIDIHDISYDTWRKGWENVHNLGDPLTELRNFHSILYDTMDAQLSNSEVKSLIRSNTKFDLVIAESLMHISFAFAGHFKAPVIGISSMTALITNFEAIGNPTHPLLYIDYRREVIGKLNFWQKLRILHLDLAQRYDMYWFISKTDQIARKHFGENVPSVVTVENNMDMLFINANPILHGVRPTVPAIVYMGNMHLKPEKDLPQNLKTLLDQSTQGVIYFSFGSNVKSKNLPLPLRKTILATLGDLPYTVLWKFEDDTLHGKPDNVHISKWFPQTDVLGHPNVKAFITQGGQQSMEEAISKKVPFIGIPFIGDQPLNVQRMVALGIGLGLKVDTLTKDTFKEAIIEVAEGESYHKNIAKVSELIADSPMSGMERAVWWTEYVLRHGGARHLRAPAADVTWYEYFMLDVLATLLVMVVAALLLLYSMLRLLFNFTYKVIKSSKVKIN